MTELRSEVREALGVMRGLVECVCLDDYKKRGLVDPTCDHECAEYVDEIESELHRLTDALDRAEAERDALRARIDDDISAEVDELMKIPLVAPVPASGLPRNHKGTDSSTGRSKENGHD